MSENTIGVTGDNSFDVDDIYPQSIVLNFKSDIATMAYSEEDVDGPKSVIRKSFNDIFSNINTEILSRNATMLLPTGCIYTTKVDSTKDAFLMQEIPGVRTFRLSNKTAVMSLVAKMYNKFNAQTGVLEKNEVLPEQKEEVQKQINLRTQYIKSVEKQIITNVKKEHYKLNFRVYFPYTYILIEIMRTRGRRGVEETTISKMKAAISLEPVNTFTDYLYQFPLSNVSYGGSVCTGKMTLGNYGLINIKKYVEKMTGYFWNNRFNADITAGPETYGNVNFLGNWFEWEFNSYVNPEKIFTLTLNENSILEHRMSVASFIYNQGVRKKDSKNFNEPIHTINAHSIADGFTGKDKYGDSVIDLNDGVAQKHSTGISDTIHLEGHKILIGSLLKTKTEKDKKFKIISFDGLKTYEVNESVLIEKDSTITHVQIKDTNKKIHRIPLTDKGIAFVVSSYRKAKNYIENAILGGKSFNIGDIIITDIKSEDNSKYDIIKSIRENEGFYVFELSNEGTLHIEKNHEDPHIRKVDLMFTFSTKNKTDDEDNIFNIKNNSPFSFRRRELIKTKDAPSPYNIFDHLSEIITGSAKVQKITMEPKKHHYSNMNTDVLTVNYKFTPSDSDSNEITLNIEDLIPFEDMENDIYQLLIPLPRYIIGMQSENNEIEVTVPTINGSETVIVGQTVYQAIPRSETDTEVPFKIMREGNNASLSTQEIKAYPRDLMFFYPAAHHLKSCISEVDDVKIFTIRDLYETGTDKEYINFKVGDEIMLTSDWDSNTNKLPSIKKIYDFVTVVDKYPDSRLLSTLSPNSSDREIRNDQAKIYSHDKVSNTNIQQNMHSDIPHSAIRGEVATLYAVVDDGSEDLIFQPMISSCGQHCLNSMSHAIKEVNNLEAGDFIKADIGGMPHFPKNAVDEVVCCIKFNNRDLAIMKSGYTMWADIILDRFKIFKLNKLTAAKIRFYTGKTRLFTSEMKDDFMVIYGDSILSQIKTPLLTEDEITIGMVENPRETRNDFVNHITNDRRLHTSNIDKTSYEGMVENGTLYTFSGFNKFMIQTVVADSQFSSFRTVYDSNVSLGLKYDNINVDIKRPRTRYYDMCYSLTNSSLKNGSAYLDMKSGLYGPLHTYSYYNSPYQKSHDWVRSDMLVASLLTFPTPRILKKSTREKESFKFFNYLGPQNNFFSHTHMNNMIARKKLDIPSYAITSDNVFPKQEEEN